MKITSPRLLAEFRNKPYCELCHHPGRVEPHHIMHRGMGDAFRLDVKENLIALCRDCHNATHSAGAESRLKLLGIVAEREGFRDDNTLYLHLVRLRYGNGEVPVDADDQRDELLPAGVPYQAGKIMEDSEDDGWVCFP